METHIKKIFFQSLRRWKKQHKRKQGGKTMIKCDKGSVSVSGKEIEFLAEFATLVHGLKDILVDNGIKEDDAKEALRETFETGLKSESELDKEILEALMKSGLNSPFLSVLLGLVELADLKEKEK